MSKNIEHGIVTEKIMSYFFIHHFFFFSLYLLDGMDRFPRSYSQLKFTWSRVSIIKSRKGAFFLYTEIIIFSTLFA